MSEMAIARGQVGPSANAFLGVARQSGHTAHRVESTRPLRDTSQGQGPSVSGQEHTSTNVSPATGDPYNPPFRGPQDTTFIPTGPTIFLHERAMTPHLTPTREPPSQ